MFASDDFNRANGALGADWASFFGGITVSGNAALGGSLVSAARWTASTFAADHWSEATISGFASGTTYPGVAVRLDASGNGYYIAIDSGNAYVQRLTGGVEFSIATRSTSWANGDVMRLEVVGTTLKVFKNGTQVGTDVTDATYSSGQPGLFCYGAATVDGWSADDGVPVGPVITADPTGQTANAGATAAFTVSATGGTLTYQWQDDSGGSFADIGGATSSTYTTPASTYAMQGRQYRCVVTDAGGSATSAAAALRVAFNLSGAGPRPVPLFGAGPFGAGDFGAYSRGVASGGGGPVTITLTTSLAAAVQQAKTLAASLQAPVQAPRSATAGVDAVLQQARTAQTSIDAVAQLARTATAALQAGVQASATRTTGLAAAVQQALAASASINLAAQLARTATLGLEAQVLATRTAALGLDAQVQGGSAATAQLQTAVQASATASTAADAAVQLARSTSATLTAAVQAAATAAVSLQAAVAQAATASVALNAQVQGGSSVVAGLQSAVQAAATATLSVQAAVQVARTASASLSAAVAVQAVLAAALQAAVQAQGSAACLASVFVDDPQARVLPAARSVPVLAGDVRIPALATDLRTNGAEQGRSNAAGATRNNAATGRRTNRP